MLEYVNRFNFAINDKHTECVMNFMQEHPKLDENGKIVGVESHVVSSVVMTEQCARNMLDVMQQLIAISEENTSDSESSTEE